MLNILPYFHCLSRLYHTPFAIGTWFVSCSMPQIPMMDIQARVPIHAKYIAHATGEYRGLTYLNSMDSLINNYKIGFRNFEIDLNLTTDGKYVAVHGGHETLLNIPKTYTFQTFLHSHLAGHYHPLDIDILTDLMLKHPDWTLWPDIKTNGYDGLTQICHTLKTKKLSCRDRVVGMATDLVDNSIFDLFDFKWINLSMYRIGDNKEKVIAWLEQHPRVSSVTIWEKWWTPEFQKALDALKVEVYVIVINDPDTAAEYFRQGAAGVMTDSLIAPKEGSPKLFRTCVENLCTAPNPQDNF